MKKWYESLQIREIIEYGDFVRVMFRDRITAWR